MFCLLFYYNDACPCDYFCVFRCYYYKVCLKCYYGYLCCFCTTVILNIIFCSNILNFYSVRYSNDVVAIAKRCWLRCVASSDCSYEIRQSMSTNYASSLLLLLYNSSNYSYNYSSSPFFALFSVLAWSSLILLSLFI